jgi:hypothetical protein
MDIVTPPEANEISCDGSGFDDIWFEVRMDFIWRVSFS